MHPSWQEILQPEFEKPYFLKLQQFLDAQVEVFPPRPQIFRAFELTPFDRVKVVILGQDPYHKKGLAEGFSFSVPEGAPIPPSLRHIFQELHTDLNIPTPSHGSLVHWAQQGVLLLNALLTVSPGKPLSHKQRGWEQFTDAVLNYLLARKDPIVFILWGNVSKKKLEALKANFDTSHHAFLTAPHPSPLSAYQGFFGCRHFSKTNAFLKKFGKKEIAW